MTQTTKADKHLHKGWEFQATTSRILKSDGTERTKFKTLFYLLLTIFHINLSKPTLCKIVIKLKKSLKSP